VQAAIAGDERGNWRDLRTVFEFAGIGEQNKDAPSYSRTRSATGKYRRPEGVQQAVKQTGFEDLPSTH